MVTLHHDEIGHGEERAEALQFQPEKPPSVRTIEPLAVRELALLNFAKPIILKPPLTGRVLGPFREVRHPPDHDHAVIDAVGGMCKRFGGKETLAVVTTDMGGG